MEPVFITIVQGRSKAKIIRAPRTGKTHVYTDSSSIEGRIGAAVTIRTKKGQWTAVRYSLGSAEQHTVYEAESAEILLLLHIANGGRRICWLTVFTDNQVAIKVLKIETGGTQSYLTEALQKTCTKFKEKHNGATIEISWVPGHKGVIGNKQADMQAKKVAMQGSPPDTSLPRFLRRHLPIFCTTIRYQCPQCISE